MAEVGMSLCVCEYSSYPSYRIGYLPISDMMKLLNLNYRTRGCLSAIWQTIWYWSSPYTQPLSSETDFGSYHWNTYTEENIGT